MIFDEFPALIRESLFYENLDHKILRTHVDLAEDQEYMRNQLDEYDLIGFIADNSILPRKSGISDTPMPSEYAVPFKSPPELSISFDLPNRGKVSGMGIPKGITLIVGGGYHGKSTVLRGIERGVYNHIPDDGRELVISNPNAVKIRAEDGRRVENVDISPFITNLPGNIDTTEFSSDEASGSTSQAANILESLELGAECLLVDEDTSATNFMIRDVRMQHLVKKKKEPITPFIDKVRLLYEEYEVSTILVIGGSGDYFDVADTIIQMDEYRPIVATDQAKKIAAEDGTKRTPEGGDNFGGIKSRSPIGVSIDARRGRKVKIRSQGKNRIEYGRSHIELDNLEQLVDESQTRAIGDIMHYASQYKKYFDGSTTLRSALEKVLEDIENKGLQVISPFDGHPGYYALPRLFEIADAINRYRNLNVN